MAGKVIAFVAPTRSGKTYLTKRLAEHFKTPVYYEVDGPLPERIVESLTHGVRQIERHLYFRDRALDTYVKARAAVKDNKYAFVDSCWVSCSPYIDMYEMHPFEKETLRELSRLDLETLPWPDGIVVIREDDVTSETLWRKSGQAFELDEEYFKNQLLSVKRSFERFVNSTTFPVPTVQIDRSGIDYDDAAAFERFLNDIAPVL